MGRKAMTRGMEAIASSASVIRPEGSALNIWSLAKCKLLLSLTSHISLQVVRRACSVMSNIPILV